MDLHRLALDTITRNLSHFRADLVVHPSPTYEGFWARDTMIVVLGLLDAGRYDTARDLLRTWGVCQIRPTDDPGEYVLLNKQEPAWTEEKITRPDRTWLEENAGGLPTAVYMGRETYPDGTREIYSCHPDPDSAAWWVVACGRYTELTGDRSLADALRPHLQAALNYVRGRDSDGDLLVEQCPNEDWADHMRRHGKVTYTQAVWYGAVRAARVLGLEAPDGEAVRRAIRATLLRPSGPLDWACPVNRSQRVAQDFSLLVLFGLVDREEGERLMQRLDDLAAPHGHRVVAPHFYASRMGPYHFKRGEYQNGGIWTWLTGWEAQARAVLGQPEAARELVVGCFCPGCNGIYEWIEPRRGARHNPHFATGAGSILSALARLEGLPTGRAGEPR